MKSVKVFFFLNFLPSRNQLQPFSEPPRGQAVAQIQPRSTRLKLRIENDLARDLKVACNHATRLELIFSEGDPGLRILREQGGATVDTMRRSGRLHVMQIPGADHTFSSDKARRDLILALASRISQ